MEKNNKIYEAKHKAKEAKKKKQTAFEESAKSLFESDFGSI